MTEFDFIVVGSGAGGATVAKALSEAGRRVLLLEKGGMMKPGGESKAYSVIRSGVEIWLAECLGGTTVVTMGNAVRSSVSRGLEPFFEEAERELGVVPMPLEKMGKTSREMLSLSGEWVRMPKCIDFLKCRSCGSCAYGCPHGAKWSSLRYVEEAERAGCRVMTGSGVRRVLVENGRAKGVEVEGGRSFGSRAVVLAAGAIESPRILLRSGISAGRGLFVDTFVTVGGLKRGAGFNREVGMPFYLKREGYLISPHYSSLLLGLMKCRGIGASPQDIVGFMVKISDDPSGVVTEDSVIKLTTGSDLRKLEEGRREAKMLLERMGVDGSTIVEVHPRGAHPGGSCSSAVRSAEDPETEVEGLFVSDASVLPGPFGLPPMLTIIAVSKRLASMLLGRS
ncbi:MAG: GMC family oxidoreductase N-terminal domain-containing protein [Candidatus Methanosuratincola verstraetei]|jgi:choline dehydrogenase-like flavoprotein